MASPSLQANGISLVSQNGFVRRSSDRLNVAKLTKRSAIIAAVQNDQPDGNSFRSQKAYLAASLALTTLLASPRSASAIEAEEISSAISQVETFASQLSGQAVETYDFVKGVLDQVVTVSKPIVDAATPLVQEAAKKALDAATPVAVDVANKAQQALVEAGVDTKPVFDAAKTAAAVSTSVTSTTGKALTDATPYAQSTLETVFAQEPTVLALGAGTLVLLYLLAPSIGSSILYSARGYAGDLTAAQTLDLLTTQSYTLVDIRTEKEKGKTGIPALPRSAQNKRFFIPVEDLPSKLRSQLRNSRAVEAELTAIKIAALKKLNKGSSIALLDSNGSIVKQVAKALCRLGFGNVYIVKDGTDGSTGWVQSQLAVDSYRSSALEILSPSRVVSGTIFSPRSSTADVPAGRKGFLLPGGDE